MRLSMTLTILALACGDDGAAILPPDAGPTLTDDAAAFDAGQAQDAGPPPTPLQPSGEIELTPPPARYEDPDDLFNAGSCYDGIDNDATDDMAEAAAVDCDDANCATLPSCCVGRPQNPRCCQTVSDGDVLAGLDGCAAGGSPLGCVTGATEFGAPTPFVDDGLALGGDGVFDSGLLFDEPIDLRTANLDVTVEIRQAACTGSCRESAAFGVTAQQTLGSESHVDPEVALVFSGERREARLLVADFVAAVWADVGDGAWRIVLRPDGAIAIGRDGSEPIPVADYEPIGGARVVAWGHSRNPGATGDDGIRIEKLERTVQVCDMPRAWNARSQVFMQIVDEVSTMGSSAPSVALDASGMPWLVYAQGGELFAASQENPSRPERWARETSPLRAGDATFSEPELVPFGEGFRLYYVEQSGESRSWMMATTDSSLENLDAGTRLVEPALGFAHASIVPIMPPDRLERFAMAASTDRGIETFSSEDGETWNPHVQVPIELLDAAEVGEPSLTVVNAGYQLAVALRRGARWSVALFASAELVHWRLVDERALEAGDGTERVGVRDLELFLRDSTLEAIYVASDGIRDTLHHAQRPLPALIP